MYAIALVAASMLGQVQFEQNCPGGICPIPQSISVRPVKDFDIFTPAKKDRVGTPKYVWERGQSDDQFLLRKDGQVIGQYWMPDHCYYPWDGSKILAATKPPIDPPTGRSLIAGGEVMAEWQMSGVHSHELNNEEVVTFGGKVIGKHKMEDAFTGKMSDDSSKGYFMIVAKDEGKRNKVLGDWMKLPDDFRSRYHLWMADPNHFTMQDRYNGKPRFFTEGDPSIILQNNQGEVLFRRPQAGHVYQQGDMQELLKSDPNYNPVLDPGAPAKTLTDYLPKLSAQQWGYVGFGAFTLFALYRRKQS